MDSPNRDVCGELVPQKDDLGTLQEWLKVGSAQGWLLQTSAMSDLVGYCGSPGVTVTEVPSAMLPVQCGFKAFLFGAMLKTGLIFQADRPMVYQ